MKTVKNRSILLVIALALVLSLTVGLTLAYFSDHTEAKGGSKLALGGKSEIHEEVDNDKKVVTIENTGETNLVVKVMIVGPAQMTVDAGDGWVQFDGDDFYYYNKILAPGESTTSITANTGDYPAGTDLGDAYQIVVVHESAQPVYDSNNKVKKPDGWDNIPDITAE